MGWPHSAQNFAPGTTLAPQLGQPPTTVFSNFSLVTYVASCAASRACCTAASVCAAEYSASRSGAHSKHKPLRIPAGVVDPFGATLALLTVPTSMITGGLYFSLIRLICQMDTLFATARDNTISIIIEQSTKTILAWRSLFVSTLNHLEEIRK
jgi:hypothetical protein